MAQYERTVKWFNNAKGHGFLGRDSSASPLAPRPADSAAEKLRVRVLTAEDDDDLRFVMQAILESSGFHVTTCASTEEAEAVFSEQANFDLLLTDIDMPGKFGVALATNLSQVDPVLPVMIVSGATITTQQRGDFSQKGWVVVSKPFSVPDLVNNIGSLLALSKQAHRISGRADPRALVSVECPGLGA